MGTWDMIRMAAAGESPEERVERARPGLERNGLGRMLDPESDGMVRLDTGHELRATMFDGKPDWILGVGHPANPDLLHHLTVHLGTTPEEVGDRIVHALGHPEVQRAMRMQMTPGGPDWGNDWRTDDMKRFGELPWRR
jgi:hypothetical protein